MAPAPLKRALAIVALALLMAALASGFQAAPGHGIETAGASLIVGAARIHFEAKAAERLNAAGDSAVFMDMPASTLAPSIGNSPLGVADSGWISDVVVSDQAWNQNNDGFQSMESDPATGDLYLLYESWTNYATGTYQWCLGLRRSTDGGATWSPEIWVFAYPAMINGVYPDLKEPDIAITPDSYIWISYTIFAYNGPARGVIDMQVFAQSLYIYDWGSGPWSSYMVTDAMGSYYNYHRLPSLAIDQQSYKPIITTMTYNAISATYSSIVAWQWGTDPATTPWDGWLVDGPVSANYIQYPCADSGESTLYITAMYYYAAGGVFDMVVYSSTNGGLDWTMVGDFYDSGNVNSFYKPSIASTKSGADAVVCTGTYTPNPSDQHQGRIGYAFSLDSGASWDGYILTMSNYQRMPYVQEDTGSAIFGMTYRQEDGGPVYSVAFIWAYAADLATWYTDAAASDVGSVPASNWFAHLAFQYRPDGGLYPCVAWSELRNAANPITELSDVDVCYSTFGSRTTVTTDPPGLQLSVGGVAWSTPQTFNWPAGFYHELSAPQMQSSWGNDYMFDRWNDAGAMVHDVLAGRTDDSYIAYYLQVFTFGIPLVEGWNLISLPLTQANPDLPTALSSISGVYDRAMWCDPLDASNPWKQYNIDWPPELNDLSQLSHLVSFWLNVTVQSATLTVSGTLPSSTAIPLAAGWNMVGYPARIDSSYTVGQLKAATGATIVEGFNVLDMYRTSVLSDSKVMKRGEGYWVYVPAATTWTVDW
jgi:hypothetical protein